MATYFVKSTGSDSDTGLSDAHAWATVAKVNATSLAAGDTVSFNKGDTWREQLNMQSGTAGNVITFNSYGSGAAPKIWYVTLLNTPGNWSEYSPNVWKITLSPIVKRSILIDGTKCNFKSTLAEVQSDKDCYYVTGAGVYYIWNAVNPALDSRLFEWIVRQGHAVYASGKDYWAIDGLDLRGGDYYSNTVRGAICLIDCDHWTVTNCTIKGSDGPAVYWYYGHDGTVTNNTISYVGGAAVIMLGTNNASSIIDTFNISNNTISYCCNSTLDVDKDGHAIGLFGDTDAAYTITNGIIASNDISYCGLVTVGALIAAYNSSNVIIRYNNIYHNYNGGITVGARNIDIYYNMIYQNVASKASTWYRSGILLNMSSGGPPSITGMDNIKIYNNLIAYNDDISGYTDKGDRAGITLGTHGSFDLTNILCKNNIVYNNYTSAGTYGHELLTFKGTGTLDVTLNYNLYWRTSNTANFIEYDGTTYTTSQFATYQTAKSQDANSLASAPLFENGTGLYSTDTDFRPLQTSPAIDAGTNVSLYTDYFGNDVFTGVNPDMGAYEYTPTGGTDDYVWSYGAPVIIDNDLFVWSYGAPYVLLKASGTLATDVNAIFFGGDW
jgi:parallel beta-helix repeat protein